MYWLNEKNIRDPAERFITRDSSHEETKSHRQRVCRKQRLFTSFLILFEILKFRNFNWLDFWLIVVPAAR